MLQRRQTLYLLTVVILGILLCFVPIIQLTSSENADIQRLLMLSFSGIDEVTDIDWVANPEPYQISGLWVLQLTTLLIPFLALVDIFLYKNRILQARLNVFSLVLCLGYYAIVGVYVWFAHKAIDVDWNVCFGACIPLVCFVLTLGATRLILKDEALVRSADRLR